MSFQIKRGDTLPALECIIQAPTGTALSLAGATVKFLMKARTGGALKVDRAAVIVDPTAGHVKHDWQAADTDTAGGYFGEFEVTWSGGGKQTYPRADYLRIEITNDLG